MLRFNVNGHFGAQGRRRGWQDAERSLHEVRHDQTDGGTKRKKVKKSEKSHLEMMNGENGGGGAPFVR